VRKLRIAGVHDKHMCPRWCSILEPHTSQPGTLFRNWRSSLRRSRTTPFEQLSSHTCPSSWFVRVRGTENVFNCSRHRHL